MPAYFASFTEDGVATRAVITARERLASFAVSRMLVALWVMAALGAGSAAVLVGTRSEFVGSDTVVYAHLYGQKLTGSTPAFRFEFLYEWLSSAFATIGLPLSFFLTFISFLGLVLIAASSLQVASYFGGRFSGTKYLLVLLASLAVSPFFISAQTNVIRQGLAAVALILLGVMLLRRTNWLALAAITVIAIGFHYTSAIYALTLLLVRVRNGFVWVIVAVAATSYLTGLSERIVLVASSISPLDVHGAISAYGVGYDYERGVRADFALSTLASGVFVTLSGILATSGPYRKRFLSLANIYWALALPFFMFGFGAFSDRFLLSAWMFLSWLVAVVVYALAVLLRVPSVLLLVGSVTALLAVSFMVVGPVAS